MLCIVNNANFFLIHSIQFENGDGLETITVSPGMHQMMIQGPPGTEPQVLQVLSLKDATALTKAMMISDVKHEEVTMIEN